MKCPVCKKRLALINSGQIGEYICSNEKCPANLKNKTGYAEFYGKTQKEINANVS